MDPSDQPNPLPQPPSPKREFFKKRRNLLYVAAAVTVMALTITAAALLLKKGPNQDQAKTVKKETPSQIDPNGLNKKSKLPCVPRGHDNYRSNNTLAIDPTDESILYIGVELKGVFKSVDGGQTWKQSDYGIQGYAKESNPTEKCIQEMGRLVIDPTNTKHLLLSRVETPGTSDMPFSENAGLWESKDAGATWHQLIKPGMNMSGSKAIAIDPNDPKTIYYGINNGRPSNREASEAYDKYNRMGILYVTRDGSKTWQELPTGAQPGLRAMSVYVDKANPQKVWLFTLSQNENGEGTAPPDKQLGTMVSADSGATWQSFGSKLPASTRAVMFGTLNPQDGNNAYVTGHTHGGAQASFATLDGGVTWRQTNQSMYLASYDIHDPSGKRLLGYNPFMLPTGIYESLDKGLTWRYYSPLPPQVNNSDQLGVRVENIVFAPKTKGVVFMSGSKGHIWKSGDNGRSWETLMTLDAIGGENR